MILTNSIMSYSSHGAQTDSINPDRKEDYNPPCTVTYYLKMPENYFDDCRFLDIR